MFLVWRKPYCMLYVSVLVCLLHNLLIIILIFSVSFLFVLFGFWWNYWLMICFIDLKWFDINCWYIIVCVCCQCVDGVRGSIASLWKWFNRIRFVSLLCLFEYKCVYICLFIMFNSFFFDVFTFLFNTVNIVDEYFVIPSIYSSRK